PLAAAAEGRLADRPPPGRDGLPRARRRCDPLHPPRRQRPLVPAGRRRRGGLELRRHRGHRGPRGDRAAPTTPAAPPASACLSEAALHTITSPNGDVTHCFAMLFLARRWSGDPRPDEVETSEMLWADVASPPSPLEAPAVEALRLFAAYRESGAFQVS